MDKIKFSFVPTSYLTRYCCALGGSTDKESILIEVTEGPYAGFRVAPSYLRQEHDVDADLDALAEQMEANSRRLVERAKEMRALKGRLELPTYAEYRAVRDAYDAELQAEQEAEEARFNAEMKAEYGEEYAAMMAEDAEFYG